MIIQLPFNVSSRSKSVLLEFMTLLILSLSKLILKPKWATSWSKLMGSGLPSSKLLKSTSSPMPGPLTRIHIRLPHSAVQISKSYVPDLSGVIYSSKIFIPNRVAKKQQQ